MAAKRLRQWTEQEGISSEIARRLVMADGDLIDRQTTVAFRRSLLDFLGCAIGATQLPTSQAISSFYQEMGGRSEASILGSPAKLPAPLAAFVNGALAHGLDFDEGHTAAGSHPGAVIFPAALAAGQRQGASFAQVMVATVLGYEVMLGLAQLIHPQSASCGWHNTGIAGVFGATAAAGKLYGLSAAQLANGFGLAMSFASGTLQFQDNGADTKRLHAARAAHDGLIAAALADRHVTGPSRSLEGPYGFGRMFSGGDKNFSGLLSFAEPALITKTYFKPFVGNRHLHAALDALLYLRNAHGLTADMIDAISIHTYSSGVRGHTHLGARSALDAQSSMPLMAAMVLIEGQASPDTITRAGMREDVRALAGSISVHIDATYDAQYPRQRAARVAIVLKDGRILNHAVSEPLGEHVNPLSEEALADKFRQNCRGKISAASAEMLIERVCHVDRLADVDSLLSGVACGEGALLKRATV